MAKQQRDDKLMQAVGKRLREAREARALSQEQVLFLTGIYLTRIENGHRNISISTLLKLCQTYSITAHDFFKKLDYEPTDS